MQVSTVIILLLIKLALQNKSLRIFGRLKLVTEGRLLL